MKKIIRKHLPHSLLFLYNRLISRHLIRRKLGAWFKVDWKHRAYVSNTKEWVETYDESWENITSPDLSMLDLERIRAKVLPQQMTLDTGCGDGYLLEKLKDILGFKAGIDLSYKGLQRARKKLGDNTFLLQASLEALPFKDKAFTQTLSTHTLEHIRNLDMAIEELRRITGKRIIILIPSQDYLPYTEDYHLHFFPQAEDILKYIHFGQLELEEYIVPTGEWSYQGKVFLVTINF